MKIFVFRLVCILFILIFVLTGALPVRAGGAEPAGAQPGNGLSDGLPPLPDDIMSAVETGPQGGLAEPSAAGYSVLPILFVPADLAPNPYGLRYIDQRMQLIQRWYAEQLRGRTFTLQPAVLVRGSYPLSHYYGDCYPPDDCQWGYEMWNATFADLPARGYPYQPNVVRGVFFQHNGLGGPALGGGGDFLVALDADNNRIHGDCLEPGCASSVARGGAAHELGHALGLPHTVDDPEGSPGVSLMSYGFYGFPQATLVNTALNPERNTLLASPFLNVQMSLADGGFEDCLAGWSVLSGSASCSDVTRRSGLRALTLSPSSGSPVQVRQQAAAAAQKTYDISGWVYSPDPGSHHAWIQVLALSAGAQVLSDQVIGDLAGATQGWQRLAASIATPAQTASLQIRVYAAGTDTTTIYVDDLDVHEAKLVPPVPLQIFHFDGDTVDGAQPLLQWDDVTSAVRYQVQVGAESSFGAPAFDASVTSPWFPVPAGLSIGSQYFWRVRAVSGAGTSAWSGTWSFVTAAPQDYLSDEFEEGSLAPSWAWVRQDASSWWLGGPPGRRGTGYLGITAQAGDLLGGDNSAKNLLLKEPPAGNYNIGTKVDFWEPGPSVNYQQAGLLIYQDDNNYAKLVRGYSNGNQLQWLVEVNGVVVQDASIPIGANPPMRITRLGNQYTARYSVDGITWSTLGSPVTAAWSHPRIGLAAFSRVNAPPITAFFDYFRVSFPPAFADVPASYWAWSFVERLYKAGITGGCGVNPPVYCPEGTVTRGQMAVFLLRGIHGSAYAPPAVGGSTGFGDVPPTYWSAAFIKQLSAEGITAGCGNGNYCPEGAVNRAQMAVFLLRAKYGASYTPPPVGASTGFGDVPADHWAAAFIKQLVAEGITVGCGSGNYCPEGPVTRAQMAVFLVRTFSLP